MARTLTNERTGETITTNMSNAEAARRLADLTEGKDKDHWIWFWIHKFAQAPAKGDDYSNALTEVAHLFLYAIGHGLKRPRVHAVYRDTRFQLYLSKRGTLCFKAADRVAGSENDWHAARYIGCIYKGSFLGPNNGQNNGSRRRPLLEIEQEFINHLEADATGFLAQCSKDLGTCCYCNQPLTDEYSKAAGYGPICATRWGLPHGPAVYDEKAPNFSRMYRDSDQLRGLMAEIQEDPHDDVRWEVCSDWLGDHGLPRMKAPSHSVVLPAA